MMYAWCADENKIRGGKTKLNTQNKWQPNLLNFILISIALKEIWEIAKKELQK